MGHCLLQFILLKGKDHYEEWKWENFVGKDMTNFVPSKTAPGTSLLYRLSTKPALDATLGIKIVEVSPKQFKMSVNVQSEVSPKSFMTTSMGIERVGKDSLTYLSEKEYGDGDGSLENMMLGWRSASTTRAQERSTFSDTTLTTGARGK